MRCARLCAHAGYHCHARSAVTVHTFYVHYTACTLGWLLIIRAARLHPHTHLPPGFTHGIATQLDYALLRGYVGYARYGFCLRLIGYRITLRILVAGYRYRWLLRYVTVAARLRCGYTFTARLVTFGFAVIAHVHSLRLRALIDIDYASVEIDN